MRRLTALFIPIFCGAAVFALPCLASDAAMLPVGTLARLAYPAVDRTPIENRNVPPRLYPPLILGNLGITPSIRPTPIPEHDPFLRSYAPDDDLSFVLEFSSVTDDSKVQAFGSFVLRKMKERGLKAARSEERGSGSGFLFARRGAPDYQITIKKRF